MTTAAAPWSAMVSRLWCGYLQLMISEEEFESRFHGSAMQEPRLRMIVVPWELQQNSMVYGPGQT
jgi:hypothetical protein